MNSPHDNTPMTTWEGGARSISPGALVIVRFRDGLYSKARRAGSLRWEWTESNDDIVAYRVFVDD